MHWLNSQSNVLVNGCSFSRGPMSWPYYLQFEYGFNLVNLAQAAAGNLYIHNSTISELGCRKYDLVLIMWSGLDRVDCQVDNIDFFCQTPYTSLTQSQRNDWPEKIVQPINDQDYIEKNWVFVCTGQDKFLKEIKFCESQFKFVGPSQKTQQSLIHMISLQSILKQFGIPYVFSFYQNYLNQLSKNPLFHLLDLDCVCDSDNINDIAQRNKWLAQDKQHPSETAHNAWAKELQNFLTKI
jgi:hypothetical protein